MRGLLRKYFVLLSSALSLTACEQEEISGDPVAQAADTIAPVIRIQGNESDTTCLYLTYKDPGVVVFDAVDGMPRCSDLPAYVTGTVNTGLPGIYYLNYSAEDAAGNPSAIVTRTVHVIENSAGFLSGVYNVACTCTALASGSSSPTITTDDYIASVSPGRLNRNFSLTALRIGPERVSPEATLSGRSIQLGFSFSPADYHLNSALTGTLGPAGNSFTVETRLHKWSSSVSYACRNVYTNSRIDSE